MKPKQWRTQRAGREGPRRLGLPLFCPKPRWGLPRPQTAPPERDLRAGPQRSLGQGPSGVCPNILLT
ncbi:MAG: hypothetical protein GY696_11450 [Gammaproteobacteria bacterium]|nr:hypothetical protein [Gammaproteobacteria bacterium]